ncbi:hypothetical protein C345_01541 [Cryptococcus neoformans A2-102-5]|uniref:Uncharacterized protein n=1 Tax=Cryptococcus neoformans Tu259-1 TaxID=1230072 RepID=A0A854QHN0_CRYNE|nr:hypothetical protein C361_01537 [Cryptococcus neoformans var. grubii Tu259-1]OXG90809.1 hypothetical protein C346_01582 [Cryptococcus neoformans var. grubii D17-1]OXG97889.1 hypothetical protein C345_01541 [Cryptococcus neoformans var. grubii A2-102-5]OXL10234.1 hypothetical protein C348_01522 [Cryptococcus neoformans var. grubii Gb118]
MVGRVGRLFGNIERFERLGGTSEEAGKGLDNIVFLIRGDTFTWMVIRSARESIGHRSLFAWTVDDVEPRSARGCDGRSGWWCKLAGACVDNGQRPRRWPRILFPTKCLNWVVGLTWEMANPNRRRKRRFGEWSDTKDRNE